MKSAFNRTGFTLIEILVAAGIASIIFAVGYYAVATTINTSNVTTQRVRDTENARLFFQMLERDLASATPGPTMMVKGVAILSDNPVDAPHPSPILLTVGGSSNVIIQFYCRTDNTSTMLDQPTFVRYYVNRGDGAHTICRQITPFDPNAPQPNVAPDVDYASKNPAAFTKADNDYNQALFDNVRSLSATFQQWNSEQKKYLKESDPGFSLALSDSILVTVVFTNEFTLSTPVGLEDYTAQKKTYRSFSKVLAIPAGFK